MGIERDARVAEVRGDNNGFGLLVVVHPQLDSRTCAQVTHGTATPQTDGAGFGPRVAKHRRRDSNVSGDASGSTTEKRYGFGTVGSTSKPADAIVRTWPRGPRGGRGWPAPPDRGP